MTHPKSDFEALLGDLHAIYDGDPWHGLSITTVLAGIDAKTAALRTIPRGHTIWELVLHMTSWTREVVSRVKGAAPESPEDWPVPDFEGGESAWMAANEDLGRAQRELEEAVGALEPSDLLRWIRDQRNPALETGQTVGTLIRGLLQHHAYHQGQVALLKRAAESV